MLIAIVYTGLCVLAVIHTIPTNTMFKSGKTFIGIMRINATFTQKPDTTETNFLHCKRKGERMNAYDMRALIDTLETARIYAGAEFERLCNENNHIEAVIFQSVRDNLSLNIQILKDYVIVTSDKHISRKENE